jgi:hypothetical protein
MSERNKARIPRVEQWCVRYYLGEVLLAEIDVESINRRFALWLARDRIMAVQYQRYLAADKVTVSKVHHTWS